MLGTFSISRKRNLCSYKFVVNQKSDMRGAECSDKAKSTQKSNVSGHEGSLNHFLCCYFNHFWDVVCTWHLLHMLLFVVERQVSSVTWKKKSDSNSKFLVLTLRRMESVFRVMGALDYALTQSLGLVVGNSGIRKKG